MLKIKKSQQFLQKGVNMKKEDVPLFYNAPEDFNENSTYPCDTQYMTYNPLLHRYTLTAQGLIYYRVGADRYYMSTVLLS